MVRTDGHQLRVVAGDSALVEGIKVVARAHQSLIWERQRHGCAVLRDYFPAAVEAFDDLAGADALELLAVAPDPASAARLSRTRVTEALRRARRHHARSRAEQIHAALRGEQWPSRCSSSRPTPPCAERPFEQHPDAEIVRSLPGLGLILGARVLGEFSDDPTRFADAASRRAYAETARSPAPPGAVGWW